MWFGLIDLEAQPNEWYDFGVRFSEVSDFQRVRLILKPNRVSLSGLSGLSGLGGVGKTQLATEIALARADNANQR